MTEYYIIVDERQAGPFSREDLRSQGIRPDTLVWRAGLPDWVKASELAEISDLIAVDAHYEDLSSQETPRWFAMIDGRQVGPYTVETLLSMGLQGDTPVWRAGMADWTAASLQPEIADRLRQTPPPRVNPYGQNAEYGQNSGFGRNPQYDSNYSYGNNSFGYNRRDNAYNRNGNQNPQASMRTNWLPWAIAATVASFLCSCIGCIFGIIGIVNANKANNLYEAGYDEMGDQANNTAKIMTIISLVIAGIGLVINGLTLKSMFF